LLYPDGVFKDISSVWSLISEFALLERLPQDGNISIIRKYTDRILMIGFIFNDFTFFKIIKLFDLEALARLHSLASFGLSVGWCDLPMCAMRVGF